MMTDGGVLGVVELELLLPWFAAGTLSRREAGAVECALARSPEFAHRLDVIRQEMAETVLLAACASTPAWCRHRSRSRAGSTNPAPMRPPTQRRIGLHTTALSRVILALHIPVTQLQ